MGAAAPASNVVLVRGGFADGSGWPRVDNLPTRRGYHTKPSSYLVTTEDRMIAPQAQRAMSQRAGSKVTEVAASRSAFLSQPAAVADLIEQAAAG
jgi:hypothetical protein